MKLVVWTATAGIGFGIFFYSLGYLILVYIVSYIEDVIRKRRGK